MNTRRTLAGLVAGLLAALTLPTVAAVVTAAPAGATVTAYAISCPSGTPAVNAVIACTTGGSPPGWGFGLLHTSTTFETVRGHGSASATNFPMAAVCVDTDLGGSGANHSHYMQAVPNTTGSGDGWPQNTTDSAYGPGGHYWWLTTQTSNAGCASEDPGAATPVVPAVPCAITAVSADWGDTPNAGTEYHLQITYTGSASGFAFHPGGPKESTTQDSDIALGTGASVYAPTTTVHFSVKGTYDWRVIATCGDGTTSQWGRNDQPIGDAGSGSSDSSDCVPHGWSILSPAAYVHATICIFTWAFVPKQTDVNRITNLFGDMSNRAPFSILSDGVTFIPQMFSDMKTEIDSGAIGGSAGTTNLCTSNTDLGSGICDSSGEIPAPSGLGLVRSIMLVLFAVLFVYATIIGIGKVLS